jgi:hypothetical protein
MREQSDFTTQLSRLAPEVDEAAARELFERRRRSRPPSRWLLPAAAVVLILAGVVGLVVVTGDDAGAPAGPVDTTVPDEPDAALRPAPGETVFAGEEHFDVVIVAETTVGFGNAELVTSEDELSSLWAEWNPGVDQPAVDFAGSVALVMTRPDNACADVVTQFEVTGESGTAAWTPVFEALEDECVDPLLSWLYAVAIDRVPLGDRALIRVPSAPVYDVAEQIIEYTAPTGTPDESADAAPVTLTPTDVVVALPPVGEPSLHNTSIGMFYVVHHDGGDVSVLPATMARTTQDEGVTMLRSFVTVSESGGSFSSDGDIWDARGRAATAGRASDLVGYAGQVVGDEVEVLYSDATRVEGDPEVPDGEDYPFPPELWEPTTPEQFMTLSSSGPVWRLFDAQLVVEDGVGRICRIDTSVPVDQFDGCDETSIVIDTLVTSTNPDITTWYESPILAYQDPLRGGFTNVIPLAGYSSRNDAALGQADDSGITNIQIVCGGPGDLLLLARVELDLPAGASRTLTIVDGDRHSQRVRIGADHRRFRPGCTTERRRRSDRHRRRRRGRPTPGAGAIRTALHERLRAVRTTVAPVGRVTWRPGGGGPRRCDRHRVG